MPKNKTYTPAFKAEAIRLVTQENLYPVKVPKDLGISHTALSNWLQQARIKQMWPVGRSTGYSGSMATKFRTVTLTEVINPLEKAPST